MSQFIARWALTRMHIPWIPPYLCFFIFGDIEQHLYSFISCSSTEIHLVSVKHIISNFSIYYCIILYINLLASPLSFKEHI